MTLHELIALLELHDPELVVPSGFGRPMSWRGVYSEIAFEPKENVTVESMLAEAKSAIGKEFCGYKGGEYLMDGYTDVHISNYGESADKLYDFLYGLGQASKASRTAVVDCGASVLQDWVVALPLRFQGTLLTAPRGCDDEPKTWTKTGVAYSPGRRLTAFIRYCFMNPADPREVDYEEGAFFRSVPPDPFKPSEFGHLPQHWYSHAMHALEIIGYYHPHDGIRHTAYSLYVKMVRNMHLNIETKEQQWERLTEDRIATGVVTS